MHHIDCCSPCQNRYLIPVHIPVKDHYAVSGHHLPQHGVNAAMNHGCDCPRARNAHRIPIPGHTANVPIMPGIIAPQLMLLVPLHAVVLPMPPNTPPPLPATLPPSCSGAYAFSRSHSPRPGPAAQDSEPPRVNFSPGPVREYAANAEYSSANPFSEKYKLIPTALYKSYSPADEEIRIDDLNPHGVISDIRAPHKILSSECQPRTESEQPMMAQSVMPEGGAKEKNNPPEQREPLHPLDRSAFSMKSASFTFEGAPLNYQDKF